ncbi:MAG TPA: hypothetical protein VFG14_13955 [Chthoniobacteraceae bacterium]|nr:hypothetical protein [Chthoniobacteraceae bacterium]
MQSIDDKQPNFVQSERGQDDLLDPSPRLAHSLERLDERMRGADLIVPVSAHQEQVSCIRERDQMVEKVERRCIEPLQIIEEQRERMLLPRKRGEEALKNRLKAMFGVLRGQIRNRRLGSDNQLELGNQVDNELAVGAKRLAQDSPPSLELGLVLAQKRSNQASECLSKCGVRDVALVLIELA